MTARATSNWWCTSRTSGKTWSSRADWRERNDHALDLWGLLIIPPPPLWRRSVIEKDRDRLYRLVRYAADEVAAVEGRIDREAYEEVFATQEVRRLLDAAALGLEAMAGVGAPVLLLRPAGEDRLALRPD